MEQFVFELLLAISQFLREFHYLLNRIFLAEFHFQGDFGLFVADESGQAIIFRILVIDLAEFTVGDFLP